MSLKVEGQSCPVCHAYLFDEDDIVYCPECGAPHHRDCYNSIGHCALEADHGTQREYSFENQQRLAQEKQQTSEGKAPNEKQSGENEILCPYCRELYCASEPRCPKCGNLNIAASRGYAIPDPLGGTPADMDIGDSVTAKEAAAFVLSNSHRYVPKFARIKMGNVASWNWAAFLVPEGWFLFRKMHRVGIVVILLTVAFSLCTIPFMNEFNLLMEASGSTALNPIEYYSHMLSQSANVSAGPLILAGISSLLQLIMHIICGLFGDSIYRRHTLSTIKTLKEQGCDIQEELRKQGNVNVLLFLIGIMISSNLPQILYLFATSFF